MFNRIFTGVVAVIIALGAIGLFNMVINRPFQLLRTIAITIIVIGVILFIYKQLIAKNQTSSGYQKAVKQSKKRYGTSSNHFLDQLKAKWSQKRSHKHDKQKRRKHLRVIEGNKQNKSKTKEKKKNRALH